MYRIVTLVVACVSISAWGQPAQAQGNVPSSTDRTREILEAYWENHDPSHVAQDAVFVMMPTGEEIHGRDAIERHLHHIYHEAFTAKAERINAVFGENKGLLEAVMVGTHTGEFAGIPATGREIQVPLAVSYELEGGRITRARIYMMANVLFQQIGPASEGSPAR